MIADFRALPESVDLDTDVCIIGAGAAGLALAHAVAGPLRVLVLEAGGRHPPAGDDDFLAGEATDFAFAGFTKGRRRAFGGATRAWFGQCIRLDPIDFERRDWVANSGWPLSRADLDPFYDRAEQMLGIGKPTYDARIWREAGLRHPAFNDAEITPRFTIYCPQPDFTKLFGRRYFRDHADIRVLLNAAVVRIELAQGGGHVAGVRIRANASPQAAGRQGRVRARAYVLCGGGIENARLLLASNDVQAAGVGNARDRVGRFFQDHPSAGSGVLCTTRPRPVQRQFRKLRLHGLQAWPKLALTDAAQRRLRVLNATSLLFYDYPKHSAAPRAKALVTARDPATALRDAWHLLPHLPELALRGAHTLATGLTPVFTASRVMLKAHVEQVPDPDNRITLAAERDRFGVPRARLHWRIDPLELATMRAVTEAAGRELHRLGFGEMHVAPWLDRGMDAARGEIEDNYHHAGATRMAATPAEGVVDTDCRVFEVANLYIAGSSVFPTSGYANPTLTIVALAIRLADRLRRELAAP